MYPSKYNDSYILETLQPYNEISSTLDWTGLLSVFSRQDDILVVVLEELFVIF